MIARGTNSKLCPPVVLIKNKYVCTPIYLLYFDNLEDPKLCSVAAHPGNKLKVKQGAAQLTTFSSLQLPGTEPMGGVATLASECRG